MNPASTRHRAGSAVTRTWPGLLALTLVATGCTQAPDAPAHAPNPQGAGAAGPPVSVTLARAQSRSLPITLEATGTIMARRSVEVRAQSAAVVRAVLVQEGQQVRAGQALFQLDDRNERAQLERAQAQLLKDEAAWADARRQLRRGEDLLGQNFISQGAVDVQRTAVQTQEAAVAASRAAVHAAQVSLSYMAIAAPQAGRLGAISVQPGAYVGPAAAALVTISQMDPVLVTFSVPQRHLADALQALKTRTPVVEVAPADDAPGRKTAGQPAETSWPIVFVDNAVDAASGTVRVRAEMANAQSQWWPGAYVRVRMRLQGVDGAVVVPLPAIVQSARGRSVFTVDEQGLAQQKAVEVLATSEGLAAIKGIEPGQSVVVDGRQNLRNGSKVVDRGAGAASK